MVLSNILVPMRSASGVVGFKSVRVRLSNSTKKKVFPENTNVAELYK